MQPRAGVEKLESYEKDVAGVAEETRKIEAQLAHYDVKVKELTSMATDPRNVKVVAGKVDELRTDVNVLRSNAQILARDMETLR